MPLNDQEEQIESLTKELTASEKAQKDAEDKLKQAEDMIRNPEDYPCQE